ncbi:hypothetical protein ACFWY5_26680 [Nonomuraea sp. NPDC059007]
MHPLFREIIAPPLWEAPPEEERRHRHRRRAVLVRRQVAAR